MTPQPDGCRCTDDGLDFGLLGPMSVERRGVAYKTLWRQVPVVLLFGVSAHAAKNALAPAQPALSQMGMSPILYSIIAASPMLGSVVLPALWGSWYGKHEKLILVIVPFGEFVGQLVIVGGLACFNRDESSTAAKVLISFGFTLFSAFHAGAGVVQHTVLARILPYGLTTGFVAIIGCTHLTKALCNFTVPWMLDRGGLLGVQLMLLVPSFLSSVAGCLLAATTSGFAVPHVKSVSYDSILKAPLLDEVKQSSGSSQSSCSGNQRGFLNLRCMRGLRLIMLISLWRALVLGTMHAFGTVYNGLLVSYGLTPMAAGSLIGTSECIALCVLPIVGVVSDVIGSRGLIFVFSWLTLVAAVVLAFGQALPDWAWVGATFAIGLSGTVVPVLPLALVPANSERSLGRSYGVLETVGSAAQVLLILSLGFIKSAGGFPAVMFFVCTFLLLGAISSVLLVFVIKGMPEDLASPASPILPA